MQNKLLSFKINDTGNHAGKTIHFANFKDGNGKLLQFIKQHKLNIDNSVARIETPKHYWFSSTFLFLHNLEFKTTVINPYNQAPYAVLYP